MPPELPAPGSPADWLRHARSDLALARIPIEDDVLAESLCFHAQQASEKSIKAVLLHFGHAVPKTHDIAQLITLVSKAGIPWDRELEVAAELTEYAVELRYPHVAETVFEESRSEAVTAAERVVA
jgi:HEPN domain-containing protein